MSSLWVRRGGAARSREVLPAGTVTRLIIDIGAPSRILTADGELVASPGGAFLIGPHPVPLVLEHSEAGRQCGADLTPVGVAAFTTVPLAELVGRVRDATPILRWSETWPERLRGTDSADDALEVLQQLLRSVRRRGFVMDPRAARAVRRLEGDPVIPIAALAAEAGLTPGGFTRLFRRGVGMTPRDFARLVAASREDGAPSAVR